MRQAGPPATVLSVCLASTWLLGAQVTLTSWGNADAAVVKLAVLGSSMVAAWFLRRRPLPLHADGDDLGDVEEAVFASVRDAARMLV